MKNLILFVSSFFLLTNVNGFSAESDRSLLEKIFNRDSSTKTTQEKTKSNDRDCRYGIFNPPKCKGKIFNSDSATKTTQEKTKSNDRDCRYGIFNPPKCKGKDSRAKNPQKIKSYEKKEVRTFNEKNNNISVYTGTFDIIDKEGDDKTTLFGIEHKNSDLFRDTFLGKFKPVTGGFMTGKSSVYLYTGVEGQYGVGPLKILPSFTPGYYEKGSGKDLGSALEFKSEIKLGLDIFDNSNLSYSYSHISNNDWGTTNPGTDNQQITFSKIF